MANCWQYHVVDIVYVVCLLLGNINKTHIHKYIICFFFFLFSAIHLTTQVFFQIIAFTFLGVNIAVISPELPKLPVSEMISIC